MSFAVVVAWVAGSLLIGGAGWAGWRLRRPAAARRSLPYETFLVLNAVRVPLVIARWPDGGILFANGSARSLLGRPDKPCTDMDVPALLCDPAVWERLRIRLRGAPDVEAFPMSLRALDGRSRDVRIDARRLRFAGQDTVCMAIARTGLEPRALACCDSEMADLETGTVLHDPAEHLSVADAAARRPLGVGSDIREPDTWEDAKGDDTARPEGTPPDREPLVTGKEAFRSLVEAAPFPVVVLDRRTGEAVLSSAAARTLFQLGDEGGEGIRPADSFLAPYVRARDHRAILAALRRDGMVRDQEILIRPDGKAARRMLLSAHALCCGDVPAVAVFLRDPEDGKHLHEALHAAKEDLSLANEDLEQFAHAASQDIRAPLRMIGLHLDAIRHRIAPDTEPGLVETLLQAVEGLARLDAQIGDLLEYVAVGRWRRAPTHVDTAKVFDAARKRLSVMIAEHDARVQCESHLPVLRGDENDIGTLFEHLIGNAVKYRHPDRRPLVRVSARLQNDGEDGPPVWHFRVSDNGIGIAARHFDRIFQLFQRLHPQSTYGGTGIGLALCHKIVRRHGGRIWVESEEGEGSVFHVTLPHADGTALPTETGAPAAAD